MRSGHLVDGVEEHFGGQPFRVITREILFIDLVVLVWNLAELINLRAAYRPHQVFQIVAVRDKVFGQAVEQFRIRRRIGLAHVVLRFNDAAVEEMLPIAVDQRPGEIGVVLAGHPVGQRLTRIVVGRKVHRNGPQTRGLYRLFGFLVRRRWHRAAGVNHFTTRFRPGLMAHLRKEGGEAVVILLAPFLERMMMALGALHSHAQEKLGGVLEFGLRLAHPLIPGHGGIVRQVARCRQNLTHKPVVRFVRKQTVANPAVKSVRAAGLLRVGPFVAEQRAPFVGEIIGVLDAVEQPVNPLVALVRILVGDEFFCFLGARQTTGDVNSRASQESRVVADHRGRHPDRFQFFEGQFVDQVFRWRQSGDRRAERNGGAKHGDFGLVTHHHRDIARLFEQLHVAGFIGFGHFLVVRFVQRASRHVFHRAVRVPGHDDQLLFAVERHDAFPGKHFDPRDSGIPGLSIGHPFGNPANDQSVVVGVCVQLFAAAVGQRGGRFQEQ